jgi:hypothetical protein
MIMLMMIMMLKRMTIMMMMMAWQDECRRPYRLIGYLCSPVEPTRRAQADQLEANLLHIFKALAYSGKCT